MGDTIEFTQYSQLILRHMEDSRIFQQKTEISMAQLQSVLATLSQQVANVTDVKQIVIDQGKEIAALRAQAKMWAGMVGVLCTAISIVISLISLLKK